MRTESVDGIDVVIYPHERHDTIRGAHDLGGRLLKVR